MRHDEAMTRLVEAVGEWREHVEDCMKDIHCDAINPLVNAFDALATAEKCEWCEWALKHQQDCPSGWHVCPICGRPFDAPEKETAKQSEIVRAEEDGIIVQERSKMDECGRRRKADDERGWGMKEPDAKGLWDFDGNEYRIKPGQVDDTPPILKPGEVLVCKATPELKKVLTEEEKGLTRLRCNKCGKSVSSPVSKNTLVRAWLECPECIEKAPPAIEPLADFDYHCLRLDGNGVTDQWYRMIHRAMQDVIARLNEEARP